MVASGGCDDDRVAAPGSASRVTDPAGDVRPAPSSKTPQPPGIDLVAAELTRDDKALTFTATTADEGGETKRLWVVRLRDAEGGLRYMLYAGEPGVLLCDGAQMCFDVAEGATLRATARSAHVRVPLKLLRGLPERFEWEASASGVFTANIEDTWNDFAPTATMG